MIAIPERTQSNVQQNIEQLQTPTMGDFHQGQGPAAHKKSIGMPTNPALQYAVLYKL